ncbi:hypothetical protein [Desmospora profundinema]|uniref:Uncharacterized protein n=1 Tax=Desmospora profundinema TaxID=1571184 RepID=A0ABU1IJ25_9BACL|nr:hypothetical protein [Desmospora profundinema]MDR6224779.1 hypothetical protein [Desmospora profundinema]
MSENDDAEGVKDAYILIGKEKNSSFLKNRHKNKPIHPIDFDTVNASGKYFLYRREDQ